MILFNDLHPNATASDLETIGRLVELGLRSEEPPDFAAQVRALENELRVRRGGLRTETAWREFERLGGEGQLFVTGDDLTFLLLPSSKVRFQDGVTLGEAINELLPKEARFEYISFWSAHPEPVGVGLVGFELCLPARLRNGPRKRPYTKRNSSGRSRRKRPPPK